MQRYPLIHKSKNPINLPQIQTPVVGEGKVIRIDGNGYGHVIVQLEPNFDADGCFMLWSVTENSTLNDNANYLLTTRFLEDVYQGLCEAIASDSNKFASIKYVPFPYENTNVRIIGGSEHSIDSRPYSYRTAAYLALEQAVSKVLGFKLPEPPLKGKIELDLPPHEPIIENSKYHNLQTSLRQKNWRVADDLTRRMIFELSGGEYYSPDDTYWLSLNWAMKIPEADLQTIDRLWTTYSRGHFGLSIHKQIFLECGGQLGDGSEQQAWECFGDCVGWRLSNQRWIWLEDAKFDLSAPRGHLPCLEWWGQGIKQDIMKLLLSGNL
ncbi:MULTISPECIES: GUN4 domain-containing protein [Nostoc]|uniref:GUN4 domain-containing protein n=1 Tax=Nostoc paludosum FACHB-159 TaxID=2692908 RepID=A0ABR8K742_9NOSO|nr:MULTISPECIES: GUN4 domain-containing protein [Nostoc]MBD2677455.1 GUN4 domain-containing protein [Nostoc sp. FACHB-857]MBD2734153.1 GUN4 domain-containing protein [Nostoc paludosum FACHB-159]